MKSRFIAALAAGLFSAAPAFAAVVTIDFDGPGSFSSIDQYYNGGTNSDGETGPNLGVAFGLDALALRNDDLGPYFSNAPSPIGILTPVGSSAAMNVPIGFAGLVSFYYSSTEARTVHIWSGLDGTGTELGTLNLLANAQNIPPLDCSDSPFCRWDPVSVNLDAGVVARSITFGDAAGVAGFDNVTITAVPEPGTWALLAVGLAGVGALVRRRSERGQAMV
jgi:hypothetical protein